jgi:ribosome-associated heat shock protein Hsp15
MKPADDEDAGPADRDSLRVYKWLWCTRFFKTRSLAQQAVEGGHVQVNGDRVRSSRLVRAGDRLRIVRERERHDVEVLGIPVRRGPAREAQLYFSETEESAAARAHARELNRLTVSGPQARPDKRERRDRIRLLKGRA